MDGEEESMEEVGCEWGPEEDDDGEEDEWGEGKSEDER